MKSRRAKFLAAVAVVACACAFAVALVATAQGPTLAEGALPAIVISETTEGSPASHGSSVDADESAVEPEARVAAPGDDTVAYAPGYVLATLADGVTDNEVAEALSVMSGLSGAAIEEHVDDNIVKLALPKGLGVERAVELLGDFDLIKSAQPNYRYYIQRTSDSAAATAALMQTAANSTSNLVVGTTLGNALHIQSDDPDDPYYGKQWALPNVNAPEAWDLANASIVSPVTVAVIDNGFLVNHEDLKGHVVDAYNVVLGSTSMGTDNADHGTHVAGIVSAVSRNAKGVASIGDNALGLMLLRVSDSSGEISTDDVVKAYDYLIKNAFKYNVRVVNMSLGAGSREVVNRNSDPDMYDIIAKARNAGIVTVAAACNSEGSFRPPFYAYPSDFDNVVSVINLKASQNEDGVTRDSSSNYNTSRQTQSSKAKNISAPGDKIYSTFSRSSSSYGYESGTSMSAPLVAGVFGLMFAVNPTLTVSQAESLLYSSAKDLGAEGWDRETGYGEIDAAAALKAAGAKAPETTTANISTCAISVSNAVYTGSAIKPTVKVVDGSTTLVAGRDYEVGSRNSTDVGTATYWVRGMGSYSGIAIGTFTISKASLSSVSLKSSSAVYNGKSRMPAIDSVRLSSGEVVSSTNYSVTYLRGSSMTTDFNSVGKITVKVTGMNNCSGVITKTFTIKPKSSSITKLKAASKAVTVKWKKRTAQSSGYQIYLATNSAFTKNVKSVTIANTKTISKTVKSLKAKKLYYAKVRTFKKVNGSKIYSSWSKAKTIRTK